MWSSRPMPPGCGPRATGALGRISSLTMSLPMSSISIPPGGRVGWLGHPAVPTVTRGTALVGPLLSSVRSRRRPLRSRGVPAPPRVKHRAGVVRERRRSGLRVVRLDIGDEGGRQGRRVGRRGRRRYRHGLLLARLLRELHDLVVLGREQGREVDVVAGGVGDLGLLEKGGEGL